MTAIQLLFVSSQLLSLRSCTGVLIRSETALTVQPTSVGTSIMFRLYSVACGVAVPYRVLSRARLKST
ncbi:hypothetical protein GN244_ATG02013 [Phytophthora infestans]|uniref:Uncharacterized protein n=1 Tax=Phytophthora infestans TaxID=4787 RepID=A0A833TLT1_PHYIN|nr:hypothetical protein GN244_ATG02013 [Phytophthora infestans]